LNRRAVRKSFRFVRLMFILKCAQEASELT